LDLRSDHRALGARHERPKREQLLRKQFSLDRALSEQGYITMQGIYEAEGNGKPAGDYFLAPAGRLMMADYSTKPTISLDF
jgi:hypothetical protein